MEVGKEYVKTLDNKQFNKIIKELEHFVVNNKMVEERGDNMVKVKAVINFNDYEARVYRNAGDKFECSEERAKVLTGKNDNNIVYAEIIGEPYAKIGKTKLSNVIIEKEVLKPQIETELKREGKEKLKLSSEDVSNEQKEYAKKKKKQIDTVE